MSLGPEHWEALYLEGRMPWDAGGVPAELETFVDAGPIGLQVLVPGCGSAYEAALLAGAGSQVLAIDFSAAAVARARAVTAGSGAVIMQADFFELDGRRYDLIYERAFMCALTPDRRLDWARQCARLLQAGRPPGGTVFYRCRSQRRPAFWHRRRRSPDTAVALVPASGGPRVDRLVAGVRRPRALAGMGT